MEILSIRLEHIDTAKRVIYIPEAKGGAREQPISCQDILKQSNRVRNGFFLPLPLVPVTWFQLKNLSVGW